MSVEGCFSNPIKTIQSIPDKPAIRELDKMGVFEVARFVSLIALLLLPSFGSSLSPEALGGMIIGFSATALLIHLLQGYPRIDGCTDRVMNTKNSKIVSAVATLAFILIGSLTIAGVMPTSYLYTTITALWFINLIGQIVVAPHKSSLGLIRIVG